MLVKLKKIMTSQPDPITTGTTGVSEAGASDERPAPSHKQKFTKANLPFPHGGNHLYIWAKNFRPALLSWAGSQEDPFGTNGMMHPEVNRIWSRLYPDIDLNGQNLVIVLNVVRLPA